MWFGCDHGRAVTGGQGGIIGQGGTSEVGGSTGQAGSTGATTDGGGSSREGGGGERNMIAAVRVSLSTNSSEIDVAVFGDGSAERTLGPSRPYGTTSRDPQPMSFPAGAPAVAAFLADLDAVGPVTQIPTGLCAKSVSSGTTMVVTVGAETSGDLECLAAAASPAAHALASDCDVLAGRQ